MIEKIVLDAMRLKLDTDKFDFVEEYPPGVNQKKHKKKKLADELIGSEGRLIVFVIGGISVYEISCLQRI